MVSTSFGLNIGNKDHSAEEDSDSEEKEDEVVFNPISLSDSESTNSSNFTQERYLSQHKMCLTYHKSYCNYRLQKNTQIFFKCSKLWNKCVRPKSAEIIQEELRHKLKVPGVTKWTSTYDTVVQMVSVKDKLGVLCDKIVIPVFKEHEISFLEEYIKLMQPLAETLDFYRESITPIMGICFPA
ncbi:unnamed protein product [Psylliodes chrysocephalus]|uniref:Uncharacterized protein n=1 Tax=Psylliodes chrysocephalus TaxID=3402493 RepID=A0A9P0GIL7_9CUCU|nr:unnamed protein product [Psylliodes chrysocephala]